jgi:murein tripeptide amidase MpaA
MHMDVWKRSSKPGTTASIMVLADKTKAVEDAMAHMKIKMEVVVDDLEAQFMAQQKMNTDYAISSSMRRTVGYNYRMVAEKYMNVTEIADYLREMVKLATKAKLDAKIEAVGTSIEGKTLELIRMRKNDGKPKTQILIDSGIHAREHHSISLALYILKNLVVNKDENSRLWDLYEFLILPVANPDGYQYSLTKVSRLNISKSLLISP